MCSHWYSSVSNGFCPDCGVDTTDGLASSGCVYSPTICDTCGNSPCDGSC